MGALGLSSAIVASSAFTAALTVLLLDGLRGGGGPAAVVTDAEPLAGLHQERRLLAINEKKAEKEFSAAGKALGRWQKYNNLMGRDLFKMRHVPGPRGPTGPTGPKADFSDKFKNTVAGTAKAGKALVVDNNKDIADIRRLTTTGAVTVGDALTTTGDVTVIGALSTAGATTVGGALTTTGATTAGTAATTVNAGAGWGINDGAFVDITADVTVTAAAHNGKVLYVSGASAITFTITNTDTMRFTVLVHAAAAAITGPIVFTSSAGAAGDFEGCFDGAEDGTIAATITDTCTDTGTAGSKTLTMGFNTNNLARYNIARFDWMCRGGTVDKCFLIDSGSTSALSAHAAWS